MARKNEDDKVDKDRYKYKDRYEKKINIKIKMKSGMGRSERGIKT